MGLVLLISQELQNLGNFNIIPFNGFKKSEMHVKIVISKKISFRNKIGFYKIIYNKFLPKQPP